MAQDPALLIDQRWDKVVDLSLRRLVYGTALGGLGAVLLLRE